MNRRYNKSSRPLLPYRPVLVILLAVCIFNPALAQTKSMTTGEDVAIAFFKTGKTLPNFEGWAKKSKNYKVAAPVLANDVLHEEMRRLKERWTAYKADESLLTIEGTINIELKEIKAKNAAQYKMYMVFPQGEMTYFPYTHMEYDFAVIPKQLEGLMVQTIEKDQYDFINKSFRGKGHGKAYMSLQLKPVKAHMEQPYKIDGKNQWALMCDVATMSLHTLQSRQTLWTHAADWYVSPATEDVRGLYDDTADTDNTGTTATPSP